MALKSLGSAQYDDDAAFYVINHADASEDVLDSHPAIREMQIASRAIILKAVQAAENAVVKVSTLGPHREAVRGYVTLARFLLGADPEQFEKMLGFKSGALRGGCRLYKLDVSGLTADNIGPRYLSSWSAGVSPRDLQLISDAAGTRVGYHRDYPAASDPIPQFVLFRPVPVCWSRVYRYGERFERP